MKMKVDETREIKRSDQVSLVFSRIETVVGVSDLCFHGFPRWLELIIISKGTDL